MREAEEAVAEGRRAVAEKAEMALELRQKKEELGAVRHRARQMAEDKETEVLGPLVPT